MTEKTKKVLVLVGAIVLCLALIAAIRLRFVGHSEVPPQINPIPTQEATEPVVNIQNTQTPEETEPVVDITVPEQTPTPSTPVPSADPSSTGTEQKIQTDPAKPEEPEKPVPPSVTPLPTGHSSEDIPQEDRNTEAPPSYSPEQTAVTSTPEPDTQGGYDQGGTYVPGFGYIESSGEGTVTVNDDMFENGNKVGSMD